MRSFPLFILSFICINLFAQSASDNCLVAPVISIDLDDDPLLTFEVDWSNKTSSGIKETTSGIVAEPLVSYAGKDAWVKFNSGSYIYMNANTSSPTNNVSIPFYKVGGINLYSSCDVATEIDKINIDGEDFYELTPNTDYYIQRLQINAPFGTSDSDENETYIFYFFEIEPNFTCENPIVLTNPDSSLESVDITFSIPPVGNNSPYFIFSPLVDYTIDATRNDIFLYQGECENFTDVSIIGNQKLLAGETYYIQLKTSRRTFNLHKRAVNAEAEGAIPLAVDELFAYDDRAYNGWGYFLITAPSTGAIVVNNRVQTDALHNIPYGTSSSIGNSLIDGLAGMNPGEQYILRKLMSSSYSDFSISEHTPDYLNQNCNFATQISVMGQAYTIDNRKKTTNSYLWYELLGDHNKITIDVIGDRMEVQLYTGTDCGDLVNIYNDFARPGGEEFEFVLPATTNKYFIAIRDKRNSLRENFSFTINGEVVSGTAPSNDVCSTAIPWDQEMHDASDFVLANTLDPSIPNCNQSEAYNSPSVWYTYTAPSAGTTQFTSNIDVYEGDCTSLTEVDCGHTDRSFYKRKVVLSPGAEYLLKVNTFIEAEVTAITEEESTCSSAQELPFSLEFTEFPNHQMTAYDASDPDRCQYDFLPDAWWTFTTPDNTNALELQNLGRNQFYVANLYSGNCSALVEENCIYSSSLGVELLLLSPATTYILRMTAFDIDEVNYQFVNVEIGDNDCSSASAVDISTEPYTIDKSQSLSYSGNLIGCDTTEPDIYKKVTCGPSGIIEVLTRTINDIPYYTELYSDCATLVADGCKTGRRNTYSDLTPGAEYILRTNTHPEYDGRTLVYTFPNAVPNFSCDNAIEISDLSGENPVTGYSIGVQGGAWYHLTMPEHEAIIIENQMPSFGRVYYGSCDDLKRYGLFTGTRDLKVDGLPAGTDIYINSLSSNYHEYQISTEPGTTHNNVVCDFSQPLDNIELLECTTGNELHLQSPSFEGGSLNFWYSFVAESQSMGVSATEISSFLSSLSRYSIYSSCDNELLFTTFGGRESALNDLTIGQEYYIALSIDSGDINDQCENSDNPDCISQLVANSYVDIEICLTSFPPPAVNDDCQNPIDISLSDETCSQSQSGDTQFSTDTRFTCSNETRELWYAYSSDAVRNIVVKPENNSVPLVVTLYQDNCNTNALRCAQDSLIFLAEEGLDYLIAISPLSPTSNTIFDLCVQQLQVEGGESNIGIDVNDPLTKLQVNGGITVGNTEVNLPGAIRFNGDDFQGFSTEGWKSLTQINEDVNQFRDDLGNHQAITALDMNSNMIANLPDPLEDDHAANKRYVDNLIDVINVSIEELNIDSISGLESGIENVVLKQETGTEYFLNIETENVDFVSDMSLLYSGWSFERPQGGFPYIYNNERNIAIGDQDPKEQLHIYNNVPMRIGGLNDYFNLEYAGKNLSISAVTDASEDQHLIMDYTVPGTQATSFDFDLRNKRLGINKDNPAAYLHVASPNQDAIQLERNGNINTVFDRDGKLGVGILDPQKEIDVDGGIQVSTNSSASDFQLNLIEKNSGAARLNMSNTSNKDITLVADPSATLSQSKLIFYIEDAGNVMTVEGRQRVGINDTSPDYTLDVEAVDGANPFRVGTGSASDTYIKVLDNGDVGIGGDPDTDLHLSHEVGGSTRGFTIENEGASSGQYWRMYVSSSNNDLRLYNGTSTITARGEFDYASGAYTSVSDGRLKSDIKDLHFDWDNFMQLRPTNYFFKSDEIKRLQLGLIAQEVESIYPELVHHNEKEDSYKLDYSGTGVVAIKAVQELKKENTELRKLVESLLLRVSDLESTKK